MGFEFDGSPKPDWELRSTAIAQQSRRPAWSYLVAIGVFLGVSVVGAWALSFLGASSTVALPVILGGVAVWLYLRQTRPKDAARQRERQRT